MGKMNDLVVVETKRLTKVVNKKAILKNFNCSIKKVKSMVF